MPQATICQLLHSLTVGGAEVLAAGLARRLKAKYDFRFICLDEVGSLGEQLRQEGFSVDVLGRRPGLDLRCAAASRGLRADRVNILHAHQYTPFSYALMARPLRRKPPVLFTEHGRWFPDFPRRKRIAFNRMMLKRGDRVTAVGESVRTALIRNEGIPARRIEVIYNGVCIAPFVQAANAAEARRELGVGETDFVILQVARLDGLKDHLTALARSSN